MFHNILCPIDFTTFSHDALERAVAIARSSGGAVTGIYVADNGLAPTADGSQQPWTIDELPRMQAQVLKMLQEVGAPSPMAVALIGIPAVEIVKVARALPVDLIVMPSCGRTGRIEHACGSVTTRVLCDSPVPVLVIPDRTA
jgi:sulfate permease, SulP family